MLVSRKHPVRYYLSYALGFTMSAFILVMAGWLLFSLYAINPWGTVTLGFIGAVFFFPITIWVTKKIYGDFNKYARVITLNEHEIAFDKAIYPLSEIQFVCLTGKPPLGKYKVMLEEAAVIKFRNGDIRYIFDDIYTNAWKFKLALQQLIINQKSELQISKIDKVTDGEVSLLESQEFSGSQWTSFKGLMLWGVIIFFTLLELAEDTDAGWLFTLPFNIFWYLLLGYQLDYFKITASGHLVILNHALPFRKIEIRLSDIREVTFEIRSSKWPIFLRVITKDFRGKIFFADTLRTRHWFDLKIALEEHGVFVRNEAVQDFDWDLETIEKTSYEKNL